MKKAGSPLLNLADKLLFIPGLLSYFLTGVKNTDSTAASTSQLYDPVSKTWSDAVLDAFEIPKNILPEIVDAVQ